MIIILGSQLRFPSVMRLFCMIVALAVGNARSLVAAPQALSDQQVEASIEELGVSSNASLSESSGLANSQTEDAFWTINDSGNESKLFLIHQRGKLLAEYSLDCKNVDWEAMSQFKLRDQSWLVIADVGDNLRRRKSYQLQFVPEPAVEKKKKNQTPKQKIKPIEVEVHFSAEGTEVSDLKAIANEKPETKSINCEAVAVDPLTQDIWFVEKVDFTSKQKTPPGIFVLPLPACIQQATRSTSSTQPPQSAESKKQIATRIASFPIRNVTGMAFSPDGKNLVIRNYLNAHLYRRGDDMTWEKTVETTKPVAVVLPLQRQGEAVCFTSDSKSLILTSEVDGQPIWRVNLSDYFDLPTRQRTQPK